MLTKKQFDILTYFEKNKEQKTQRELAEALQLSVGTINKTLKELNNFGYIVDNKISEKGLEALEPYRVKRAVFMAAGFGSRMVPITLNTPKPLVRVKGKRMIDTLLDAVIAAGIEDIYIIRGYLSEQFDQLLAKYPQIKFLENPLYNETNSIGSMVIAGDLIKNAYVLESDLFLQNPELITKYQYSSNYLGFYVERSDDWCIDVENGYITGIGLGGINSHQLIGISYWTEEDGALLAKHTKEFYNSPGGKASLWGQVSLKHYIDCYKIALRKCTQDDIIELDSFSELKAFDPAYNT